MYTVKHSNDPVTTLIYKTVDSKRVASIDLLRGMVMVIMALDHVRDYFHRQAFLYAPEDLQHTSQLIFFTRWITHFCAPVFVLIAGMAAHLYAAKNGKKALSSFLLKRGVWLVLAELFIVTLGWTFNPSYPFFNLQVIWATGISMIVLAALIHLETWLIGSIGIIILTTHNMLDKVHVPGHGAGAILWSLLHEPGFFVGHPFSLSVRYPVLPWIAIIAIGYSMGRLYLRDFDAQQRRKILLFSGTIAILAFVLLRAGNVYGDKSPWGLQSSPMFSVLSFLNTTKYPPSLLYTLMTIGPALLFLGISEKLTSRWAAWMGVLGSVPMFYYLVHIFLIHALAMLAAQFSGFRWYDMILTTRVNASPALKVYGFTLGTVYLVWIAIVVLLYPLCKWFARYKRSHQARRWWLSYL